MSDFQYTGNELEVFKHATNWKYYYRQKISKYFGSGNVLEVGAGIGQNTISLSKDCTFQEWIALEPDKQNANTIKKLIADRTLDKGVKLFNGFLDDLLRPSSLFSTVLFIDSLEHIEDDVGTLQQALELMVEGGNLIIIAPAHEHLFNEFDAKIGHFRRYDKKSLRSILPEGLTELCCLYIDSAGYFLSLANKYILKSAEPTLSQIIFWDRVVVPISMVLDKCFGYRFGKNLILVACKTK